MQHKTSSRFQQLILSQLIQVKGALFLGALCVVGYALTQLAAPWPLKIIFDYILLDKILPAPLAFFTSLLQNGKVFVLVLLSLSIVLIALLGGLFSYGQIYITSRVGYQIVHTLRRDLFVHLQRLSLSFHTQARSGELLTKVTSDTNTLKDVFT